MLGAGNVSADEGISNIPNLFEKSIYIGIAIFSIIPYSKKQTPLTTPPIVIKST
jgi:hypothetical protein